eukprot:1125494-Karenia_brevis.AAC.1
MEGLLSANVGAEPSPKTRRVGANINAETQQLITLVAKLSLSSAQSERVFRNILLETIKVKTDSPWVTKHGEAVTAFIKRSKEMAAEGHSQEHIFNTIGNPAIHGFNALVAHWLTKVQNPAIKEKAQAVLKSWDG